MAHDPTRRWPLGVGPNNTSIPGAAWLELLNGQAFPVVGAGAMVWNGTMWVPVSTQNRLPVDAAVSGTVDVSDRADRQLGKVALSGSFVPYITSEVLAESLEVAAGATVVLPGHHQVLCEYITVGVLQVGSSDSGNLTVIVRPLMEAGWVLSKDVKAIDNVPMNNLRWLSDRVPVLADRVVIALQNHASVTRTFKVILYRLGVGANA